VAKGYSWIYPMPNANIYPALRDLEEEGFIQHAREIHEGRLRKVYTITESGRGELRRWLADPTEQRGVFRDPILLKIGLMRPGAVEGAPVWLEQELARCIEVSHDADRFIKERGDTLPKYTGLIAEFGRDLVHMRARWLARILDEFRDDTSSAPS
jgi:DNA-binding PadR family transcriptional regulator